MPAACARAEAGVPRKLACCFTLFCEDAMPDHVTRRRFSSLLLSLTLLAAGALGTGCASDHGSSGARPVAERGDWARKVMRAYDPHQKFASIKTLRFDFVIRDQNYNEASRAKHLWDRTSGNWRYEADATQFANTTFFDESSETWKKASLKLPAGTLVANVNIQTRTGHVYVNGREQPATLLKYVFDRIDNDRKWLLLPVELGPPTKVQYVNTETKDGKTTANLAVTTPEAAGSSKRDLWIVAVDAEGKIAHTGIKSPGSFLALVGVWDMDQSLSGVTFCTHRFLGERTIVYESLGTPALDEHAFEGAQPKLVTSHPSPVPVLKGE